MPDFDSATSCQPWGGIIVSLILLATATTASAQLRSASQWEEVARAVTTRLNLVRGERVLLVGAPGLADSLVAPLRSAIRAAGGVDLGAVPVRGQSPLAWGPENEFSRRFGGLGQARAAELATLLDSVDVGIMLPGATPADAIYGLMQQRLREGEGRTVHFHWAGAYALDGSLLENTSAIESVYRRALIETDYVALSDAQRSFEAAARAAEISVTTPEGTDVRFRIGQRPLTRQDGDASAARAAVARNLIDREIELPAGAIRVAPVEESVEGRIAFPDGLWAGERVEGLVMTFSAGRVVSFRATTGAAAVERELAQGGSAARSFREFALGFNPLLVIRDDDGRRWIPYYGYGAGVVRLSLGDNSELGGAVTGGYVRWNFFTSATVSVGGRVWVENGRLMPRP